MQVRGYTSETLQRLVCPIGIEGISSKQPAMIAIAVVAQLLQVFDVKNDPKGSFLFEGFFCTFKQYENGTCATLVFRGTYKCQNITMLA